jgi:hypothetical protein
MCRSSVRTGNYEIAGTYDFWLPLRRAYDFGRSGPIEAPTARGAGLDRVRTSRLRERVRGAAASPKSEIDVLPTACDMACELRRSVQVLPDHEANFDRSWYSSATGIPA